MSTIWSLAWKKRRVPSFLSSPSSWQSLFTETAEKEKKKTFPPWIPLAYYFLHFSVEKSQQTWPQNCQDAFCTTTSTALCPVFIPEWLKYRVAQFPWLCRCWEARFINTCWEFKLRGTDWHWTGFVMCTISWFSSVNHISQTKTLILFTLTTWPAQWKSTIWLVIILGLFHNIFHISRSVLVKGCSKHLRVLAQFLYWRSQPQLRSQFQPQGSPGPSPNPGVNPSAVQRASWPKLPRMRKL